MWDPVKIDVLTDAVLLNGVRFSRPEFLEKYVAVLGRADRVAEPETPAPFGHRNTQFHMYDEMGFRLSEHHATRFIDGLCIQFLPECCRPFVTTRPFTGQLTIFGVPVRAGMLLAEFGLASKVRFTPHLGHAWFHDGEVISVQLEVQKPKSGRKRFYEGRTPIGAVFIGFRNAHRFPSMGATPQQSHLGRE